MLKSALIDRQVWLVVLILVLTVLLSRWALQPVEGYAIVVHGGYWIMLGLVGLFMRALWPLLSERWETLGMGKFEIGILVAIVVTLVAWTAHEKPGYKILADELLLSGTAMGMHYEREAAYPLRATDVQGSFQILSNVMDKRPLFFPFLTAVVHDLTGYRAENPFYLNMGLAGIFLWLMYLTGWKLTRFRWGGAAVMLLFAGLALLAQQATGAGFDLLNLLMIAVTGLLIADYLDDPLDKRRLEALVFGALLLASTRYESMIFLPVVALALWLGWWRAGKIVLTWPTMLSPVFLLPVLVQNRVFADNSQAWQMASMGAKDPFALYFIPTNLGHALAFFFDFSGNQPNFPILAAMGLLSLPFFGLFIVGVLRRALSSGSADLAWSLLGGGLFVVSALLMMYFWGRFDDPVISRLSLPVHYLLVVAIAVVGAQWIRSELGWRNVGVVVLIGICLHSLPVMARQAYRTIYPPGVEMQIRADFLAQLPDTNVLFIDNDSVFWILHRIPASPIRQAEFRKESLIYHLRNHSFQAMYVFQSVLVDDKTGVRKIDPVDDLSEDFVLEPVMEKRVQTLLFARISRVKAINNNGEVAARHEPFIRPRTEVRTVEELERARSLYMENWIKQLP